MAAQTPTSCTCSLGQCLGFNTDIAWPTLASFINTFLLTLGFLTLMSFLTAVGIIIHEAFVRLVNAWKYLPARVQALESALAKEAAIRHAIFENLQELLADTEKTCSLIKVKTINEVISETEELCNNTPPNSGYELLSSDESSENYGIISNEEPGIETLDTVDTKADSSDEDFGGSDKENMGNKRMFLKNKPRKDDRKNKVRRGRKL